MAHIGGGKTKKPKANTAYQITKPKRPMSAYNFFFRSERKKIIKGKKSGQADNAKASFEDIGRSIGQRWKAIGDSELENYKKMAHEDSGRYRKEMKVFYKDELTRMCLGRNNGNTTLNERSLPPGASIMTQMDSACNKNGVHATEHDVISLTLGGRPSAKMDVASASSTSANETAARISGNSGTNSSSGPAVNLTAPSANNVNTNLNCAKDLLDLICQRQLLINSFFVTQNPQQQQNAPATNAPLDGVLLQQRNQHQEQQEQTQHFFAIDHRLNGDSSANGASQDPKPRAVTSKSVLETGDNHRKPAACLEHFQPDQTISCTKPLENDDGQRSLLQSKPSTARKSTSEDCKPTVHPKMHLTVSSPSVVGYRGEEIVQQMLTRSISPVASRPYAHLSTKELIQLMQNEQQPPPNTNEAAAKIASLLRPPANSSTSHARAANQALLLARKDAGRSSSHLGNAQLPYHSLAGLAPSYYQNQPPANADVLSLLSQRSSPPTRLNLIAGNPAINNFLNLLSKHSAGANAPQPRNPMTQNQLSILSKFLPDEHPAASLRGEQGI